MFQLNATLALVTVALTATLVACDADDQAPIDEAPVDQAQVESAEHDLTLTLELPAAPAVNRIDGANPGARAKQPRGSMDAPARIRSEIDWRMAASARKGGEPATVVPNLADLRPRQPGFGRAEIALGQASAHPPLMEPKPYPSFDLPPRLVLLPFADSESPAEAVCEKGCAAQGAVASGQLVSLDDDTLCVCFGRARATLPSSCVITPVRVEWTDGAGVVRASEDTGAERCD